ncbi:MAG: hypothetical protein IT363_05945 [Methanoregulaceae archaeon]|nr:hypothetical protein [Methanoregulaceae archaeon]
MNELAQIPLPTSIRQRLEQAAALARQDRPEQAELVATEALVKLAEYSPEMCALVIAKMMGMNGITRTRTEERHWHERVEHKLLGITYQTDMVPMVERRTYTETLSFW